MGLSFGAASLDEVDRTSDIVEQADQRMLSQKRRKQGKTQIDTLRTERVPPAGLPAVKNS